MLSGINVQLMLAPTVCFIPSRPCQRAKLFLWQISGKLACWFQNGTTSSGPTCEPLRRTMFWTTMGHLLSTTSAVYTRIRPSTDRRCNLPLLLCWIRSNSLSRIKTGVQVTVVSFTGRQGERGLGPFRLSGTRI